MPIKILTVELSGDDAKEALPLIMSVVGGDQSLGDTLPYANAFVEAPTPPALEPVPALPVAAIAPAVDEAANKEEPAGTLATRLPMPTGSLHSYQSLATTDKNEGLTNWQTHWSVLNKWCEEIYHNHLLVGVIIGSVVGFGILAAQLHWRLDQRAVRSLQQWQQPVAEETVPTALDDKGTTDTTPADASDKAGQPAKLPLSDGAIK